MEGSMRVERSVGSQNRFKLYIGNLSYATTTEGLVKYFSALPDFSHAKVCYNRHTGRSLGYAVAHFLSLDGALQAIYCMNNQLVDGRRIVVAPYRVQAGDHGRAGQKGRDGPAMVPAAGSSYGILMNLSETATWMDLKDALSRHGKVLFVDHPVTCRTAVVQFASEVDRSQVVEAMQRNPLLGQKCDLLRVEADSVLLNLEGPRSGDYSNQHVPVPRGVPPHPVDAASIPSYAAMGMPSLPYARGRDDYIIPGSQYMPMHQDMSQAYMPAPPPNIAGSTQMPMAHPPASSLLPPGVPRNALVQWLQQGHGFPHNPNGPSGMPMHYVPQAGPPRAPAPAAAANYAVSGGGGSGGGYSGRRTDGSNSSIQPPPAPGSRDRPSTNDATDARSVQSEGGDRDKHDDLVRALRDQLGALQMQ